MWLFLTLLWVGLHCETMVFPNHTARTDPANIVEGEGGVGNGGTSPSATFYSPQLHLQKSNGVFSKNFLRLQSGSIFFPGEGGV